MPWRETVRPEQVLARHKISIKNTQGERIETLAVGVKLRGRFSLDWKSYNLTELEVHTASVMPTMDFSFSALDQMPNPFRPDTTTTLSPPPDGSLAKWGDIISI